MRLLTGFCTLVVSCVLFFACQKEIEPLPEQPPTNISSKNPQAISSGIRVWHGVRTGGNAPAPRGSSLVLDASASPTRVYAFPGKYAIIQPAVSSGDVLGYYVQVAGASDHFKVDYTRPRITGRVRGGVRRASTSPFYGNRTDSTGGGGNADSSIVIALPANFQTPDTFCVNYCAYDAQGNISNIITTCIVVSTIGPDAAGGWLANAWRITSAGDSTGLADTVIYNKYQPLTYYECYNGALSATSPGPGVSIVAADSINYRKAHLSLAVAGGMKYEYKAEAKTIQNYSSCTGITHITAIDADEVMIGAWNYNSATRKMVLVFEYDNGYGNSDFEAWEYRVQKINNNHFLLFDDAGGYGDWIRFEK